MIEKYRFGSITINGKTYNHDIEVRWSGEVLAWSFRERHLIDVEEVKKAIEQNPEVIVIGTGDSGLAEVTEDAKKEIESKGIELIIEETGKAVKSFNFQKGRGKKLIGLFHLTC